MGVFAAGCGRGGGVYPDRSNDSESNKIGNCTISEQRDGRREKRKTEQDILSRISAPREELLLIRLTSVRSSEAQQVTGEWRSVWCKGIGHVCTWKTRVRHGDLEGSRALQWLTDWWLGYLTMTFQFNPYPTEFIFKF
jgi:hypothetical protein